MEKASAMLAVLACLLAAFITPSAYAAATYIGQFETPAAFAA